MVSEPDGFKYNALFYLDLFLKIYYKPKSSLEKWLKKQKYQLSKMRVLKKIPKILKA